MRFLGFLFLIALILGAVGYLRGWFSVSTVEAGDRSGVHIGVDGGKVREDSKEAAARLEELSRKAAEKVKSIGHKIAPDESEITGTVSKVDLPARELTITAAAETIDLYVPRDVPIQRDGVNVDLAELPAARVKAFFRHVGDGRNLSRIEVLR